MPDAQILCQNSRDHQQNKDQEIEKIKSVLTIFLKNHYDKIVANVNNTRVRDQEEINKIFSIY